MKQSASVENWYIKAVYLEYLSTETEKQLSADTILTVVVDDEKPWHSITATDIATQQVITILNDGLIERYTLNKVA